MSATVPVSYLVLPKVFAVLAVLVVVVAAIVVTPDRDSRLQLLLADGDLAAALEIVEADSQDSLSSAQALANRSTLYLGLGRPHKALALVEAALAENPDAQWARDRKSEIVASVGSFDQRVAWAGQVFSRTPNVEDFHFLIGAAQIAGDDIREADLIEHGMTHTLAAPDDISRLGLIRAAQGDLEGAASLLEQAVTGADRPSLRARLTLFALMTQLGKTDRAIEIALTTGLDPADPESVTLYATQSRGPSPEHIKDLLADYQP